MTVGAEDMRSEVQRARALIDESRGVYGWMQASNAAFDAQLWSASELFPHWHEK